MREVVKKIVIMIMIMRQAIMSQNKQEEELEYNNDNNEREIVVRRIMRISRSFTLLNNYITYKISKVIYPT
jgi:hypothetical protein